jgi:hypothetical protein
MPKELPIRVNTSAASATDYQNRLYRVSAQEQIGQEMSGVIGDVVTVVADFNQESLTGVIQDMDLTGALALRASIASSRSSPRTIFSMRDIYNEGVVPSNEDLSLGLVTWRVFIDPLLIDPIILTADFLDAWLDISTITSAGDPQTLIQIPIRLYQQIDSSLVGSPPPSEPAFMTAATALATFVQFANYINPTVLVAGAIPDADGRIDYLVDTTAGDVALTLGAVAGYSSRFSPNIINLGANKVQVTPNGAEEINGVTGTVEIVSLYGMLALHAEQTGGQWVAPVLVVP